MILSHVNVKPAGTRDLLELALRTGGPAEIVETADDLHHGRDGDLADLAPEAGVRADAVVDVGFQGSV